MELQHVNVKVFLDGELNVDPGRFIEVFHRWIREQTLEELLVDVADYRHVPAGPSVLLVGLEADYSLDNTGNRYGMRYNRKAPVEGSNLDRVCQAVQCAVHVCQLLEAQFEADGPLRFSRREFELSVNDRALAPNTPETFEAAKAELLLGLETILGHSDFTLTHQSGDPRRLFSVTVTTARPLELASI